MDRNAEWCYKWRYLTGFVRTIVKKIKHTFHKDQNVDEVCFDMGLVEDKIYAIKSREISQCLVKKSLQLQSTNRSQSRQI